MGKRKYRVKRHLSPGKHYQWWQIRDNYTNEAWYFNPQLHSLILEDCHLTNQINAASKILQGITNRKPCAWIKCNRYTVIPAIQPSNRDKPIFYNPKKKEHWQDSAGNNLDNSKYPQIITVDSIPYIRENISEPTTIQQLNLF